MIKRFLEWIGLKETLHKKDYEPPFFKENEIWWCYVGENIGSEINGKSDKFTRPIFIFKKYDKYSFLGLPLSTKNKTGSWYSPIVFAGIAQVVTLSQGRVLDYRRLKGKMGELDTLEVSCVRKAFSALHKIS
jgi:mRNA interferase MazF